MSDAAEHLRTEPHPISGAVYQAIGDGLVRVEDKAKGKWGVFRYDGTWIEGSLTYADPHMLIYIGGPDLPPGRDIFWSFLPPLEEDAPTVNMTSAREIDGGRRRAASEDHRALCRRSGGGYAGGKALGFACAAGISARQ